MLRELQTDPEFDLATRDSGEAALERGLAGDPTAGEGLNQMTTRGTVAQFENPPEPEKEP